MADRGSYRRPRHLTSMTQTQQPRLRYEQVAARIERQIQSGTLRPHERLPSVRALRRSAGVSIATVNEAYARLEQRGLVYARPRSGYFVAEPPAQVVAAPKSKPMRTLRPRTVAAETMDTIREAMQRADVVALNRAGPVPAGTLIRQLNGLTREVLRDLPELPVGLGVPPGELALRRRVAARLCASGAATDPDDVVITSGTMDAITLSLGVLCRSGDAVLIESPTYFGVLQLAEHLRLKVVEVPNRPESGIDLQAVRRAVKAGGIAAAVITPSFNNPTGALTPDATKRELVTVLSEAGVPVVEDDVYGDIHFGTARPPTLRAFDHSGGVITCGSFSKSIAMDYRIGWAVSDVYARDIARAKFCTSVAAPRLQQHVLVRYLEKGSYDRHLRRVRDAAITGVRDFTRVILDRFPDGTRVSSPAGGLVLWVELPAGVDGLDLFHHALAEKIGIHPGVIFSAKADYRNFVRLSVSGGADALAALQVVGRLACRLAG